MAPIQKITRQSNQRRVLRCTNNANQSKTDKKDDQKRKADCSPPKDKNLKRSAFVDITNAIGKTVPVIQDTKNLAKKGIVPKPAPKIKSRASAKPALQQKNTTNVTQPVQKAQATIKRLPTVKKPEVVLIPKKEGRGRSKSPLKKETETKEKTEQLKRVNEDSRRISSDASLYVSALEEISSETPKSKECEEDKSGITTPEPVLPPGVVDFDKENLHDPIQVSLYAMDIFRYLKEKEEHFKVADYMGKQPSITPWMRSLLVDWMVEVQESFELNHETLYLGVKLVDLYLSKTLVSKEKLQLVGAAALFVASKFDEQCPSSVEDFLYICGGAYTHTELIHMEISLVKAVDFNLGMPLSYRFLRRYARCAKLTLPMLTLARYILELSLMEYSFIQVSESRLAAASLLLALKMKLTGWTETLEYYSGYTVEDIKDLANELNTMLHKKPKVSLATIRNKYSHKIFFEVAKIPLLEVLAV